MEQLLGNWIGKQLSENRRPQVDLGVELSTGYPDNSLALENQRRHPVQRLCDARGNARMGLIRQLEADSVLEVGHLVRGLMLGISA